MKPLRLITAVAPAMTGLLGSAWQIDMAAVAVRHGFAEDPRQSVTLPCWIASAAYAHPMWSHYAILCVALRETPGVPAPVINMPGATHEVMVFALDPKRIPAVDDFPAYLQPVNFAGQFIEPDDLSATVRVQQAVQDIIDGKLNPDTDFRSMWTQRFSGSNLKPGALEPDFIAITPGVSTVVHGTGAGNARALQQIVEVDATLRADETKPQ